MVPIQNVPEGCTRASLDRVRGLSASSGRYSTIAPSADGADVKAVFRDDQLPLGIDARQRARHPAELMAANLSAAELSLEQPSLENVEPPGGVSGHVIGRPFAQMAALG